MGGRYTLQVTSSNIINNMPNTLPPDTIMITHINNIPVSNPNLHKSLRYKPAILYYLRLVFPSTINNVQQSTGEIAGMGYYDRNSIYNSKDITNNGNKIAGTGAKVLYKLGYTTTSIQERVYGKSSTYYWDGKGKRQRVAGHVGMGLPTGTEVFVIAAYQHTNASLVYQWEQYLHNKYKVHGYRGQPVMANGNTELYVRDILGLDN